MSIKKYGSWEISLDLSEN